MGIGKIGGERDRAWELYIKKFNEYPCNAWLEGLFFRGAWL